MPALAMTDHGNVFGAYDFYKQATAAGIKPIIGIEAYLTPGTARRDRTRVRWADGGENDVSGGGRVHPHDDARGRTPRACTTCSGSARWPASRATTTSPASTASCSTRYGKGLIATTGCPSGEVQTWLRIGNYDKALRGGRPSSATSSAPDNFYLELMDHGLDIERRVRDDLLRLGKRLDLPPLATNDLHYTYAERRRRARGAAVRAVRHDPGRPEAVQVRRARLLPQVAGGDARAVGRRAARGLRQHAADRRADRRLRGGVRARAT